MGFARQSLTIIGALSIIGSMLFLEYRGRSATTRMRIVQSLVVSDLALGYVEIGWNSFEDERADGGAG